MLWSRDVNVRVESCDRLHIDATISDPETQAVVCHFTGFYGEPRREFRHRSWSLLRLLKSRSVHPWLCAGDFNETLEATEQFGGNVCPEGQMDGFQDAITFCELKDMGYVGLPFTWDNRQEGVRNVKVRLDRAFADEAFLTVFNTLWFVIYKQLSRTIVA